MWSRASFSDVTNKVLTAHATHCSHLLTKPIHVVKL